MILSRFQGTFRAVSHIPPSTSEIWRLYRKRIISPRNKSHHWWTYRTHGSWGFFTAAIVFVRSILLRFPLLKKYVLARQKAKSFFHSTLYATVARFGP